MPNHLRHKVLLFAKKNLALEGDVVCDIDLNIFGDLQNFGSENQIYLLLLR